MEVNSKQVDCTLPARRHELAHCGTLSEEESEAIPSDDRLFEALMNGATVSTAAYLAGMSRRTAYRRLADPDFREQLEIARAAIHDNAVQRLIDASGAAIDRLWNLLDHEDEYLRIRVASTLLESLAKVQRVMLQYADTVQETCQLRQHE